MRNAPKFSGKTSEARLLAFQSAAPLSLSEGMSRDESIANCQVALGKKPSDKLRDLYRDEYIVGQVARKMTGTTSERISKAEVVVFDKATPAKPGTTPRPLRKGQVGRRTEAEQKAYQAGKSAFSLFWADCGYSSAKTTSEKNDKARNGKAPKPGTNAPEKVNSSDDVCKHISLQSEALLAFVNKHAGKVPLAYGEAVHAFRNAIIAANKSPAKK